MAGRMAFGGVAQAFAHRTQALDGHIDLLGLGQQHRPVQL